MNMRQHKRQVLSRMAFNIWRWAAVNQYWIGYDPGSRNSLIDTVAAARVVPEVEEAKQEYVCSKVSDGTVVDTFDTYEDALALVNKHIKGKKAKLQVMNSLTGEYLVLN